MSRQLELLGKNISRTRGQAGFNQAKFAEMMGVTQSTISQWEAGKIDIPYSTLCRIAERLGVAPVQIVDPSSDSSSPDLDRIDAIKLILDADPDDVSSVLVGLKRGQIGVRQKKKSG